MYLIPVIPLFKLKPSVINVLRLTSKNRNANDDGEDESLGYIIIHDKTVRLYILLQNMLILLIL